MLLEEGPVIIVIVLCQRKSREQTLTVIHPNLCIGSMEEFLNSNFSMSSMNNGILISLGKAEKQQNLRCSMETVKPQINK